MENNIKKIVKKNLLEYSNLEEQRFGKLGKAVKTLAKKGGEYLDRLTSPARQATARGLIQDLPKLSGILGQNTERLILVIGDDSAKQLERALGNNNNFTQTSEGVMTHIKLKNPNNGTVKEFKIDLFKTKLEDLANKKISVGDFISQAGNFTHFNDGKSLKSLFKPSMLRLSSKQVWSGFTATKALGLIIKGTFENSYKKLTGQFVKGTHGLTSGEINIIVTYLFTGIGNYSKIAQLIKIRGAKGIIPALFNLGGQFLQRYVVLYVFYSIPSIYDYIADMGWRPGKQYENDKQGLSSRMINIFDFFEYAPKALVSPIYHILYEIYDHMDGEDLIDKNSKERMFNYIKKQKDLSEERLTKEVQRIGPVKPKVPVKKTTTNNTTPVEKTL
jgi:hypothetical protein